MQRDFRGNPGVPVDCAFRQRRAELAVKCGTGAEMKGTVRGRDATWGFEKTGIPPLREDRMVVTFTGTLRAQGTGLGGTWHMTSSVLHEGGKFEAVRKP
jgi:hypothetical protein